MPKIYNKKEQNDSMKERVNLTNDEYLLLSDDTFTTRNGGILFHKKCSYTYSVSRIERFLNEKKDLCPICNPRLTKQKDTTQFKLKLKDLVGDEYLLLSEYTNNRTKIDLLHVECDRTFMMMPRDFVNGQRCSNCFKTPLKTTAEFKREVHLLSNGEHQLVSEYTNTFTKVKILHIECGNTYEVEPRKFISGGDRCPHCKESKANKFFKFLLAENEIKFESEKSFTELGNLKFDYYLTEYNLLIELDGFFHFYESFANNLPEQRERDIRKNNFCMENNISLLRIPFKRFDQKIKTKLLKAVDGLKNENLIIEEGYLFIDEEISDGKDTSWYFERF